MIWQLNPYAALPLLIAIVSCGIGAYAWRHRHRIPDGGLFVTSTAISVVWGLAYTLQLSRGDLGGAFFWLSVGMIGSVVSPVCWSAMVIHLIGKREWLTRIRLLALFVVPMLSLLFLATDCIPGLMVRQARMVPAGQFSVIHVAGGPWFCIQIAYTYILIVLTIASLVRHVCRLPRAYRAGPLSLLAVLVAVLVWDLAMFFGLARPSPVNLTSLASMLAHLIVTWGVFRYRILHLMPIARTHVMDHVQEALIVLDMAELVVDLNPAASRVFGRRSVQVIGHSFAEAFDQWPALTAVNRRDEDTQLSLIPAGGDTARVYDTSVRALHMGGQQMVGWLITLRDVTEHIEAARQREALIAQLQDALAQVNTLSGLLPICAWCGKVRSDEGYWMQLERYVEEHSDAEITHGICPECLRRFEAQAQMTGETDTKV